MDPPPQRQSKDDKQLGAVLNLYDISARLSDATLVLKEIHSVFSQDGSSDRSKESALRDIKKNLIPLLKHASDTVLISAPLVAPIASTKYVHERLEIQKKQSAAAEVTPTDNPQWRRQTIDRKSQPLRRIENTLAMKEKEKAESNTSNGTDNTPIIASKASNAFS